jgi:hypothetical protein
VTSLTWLLLEPQSPHSRKPALSVIPELRLRQIPDPPNFANSHLSWNEQQIHEQKPNSAIFFHVLLEGQRDVCDSSVFLHECRLLAKQSFPLRRWLMNLFTNSATLTFRGCKVFDQFPNTNFSVNHRQLAMQPKSERLGYWLLRVVQQQWEVLFPFLKGSITSGVLLE